jgi:soluble lytic murein transglycosylase-like protein
MAHVESGFNKRAVSPKGACGVMQVMPYTASLYGVTRRELFDEDINIQVGLYYMKEMLARFEDRDLALAAYNCGPNRIMASGYNIPRIPETRNYVRRVNNAARRYNQEGF